MGRITLKNRCFLRKCKFKTAPKPILSATTAAITPTINTPHLHPDSPTSSSKDIHSTIDTPKQTTHTLTHPRSFKIPRALSRLLLHNRPGFKERQSPHVHSEEERWRSYCPNAQDKIINNTYRFSGPAGVWLTDKNM